MGRQPPIGLAPSRLKSAAISWFCCWFSSILRGSRMGRFLPFCLYFSLMPLTCGVSFCIFNADFMLVRRSGKSTTLMMTVRMMMDMPQLEATFCCVQRSQRKSGREMKLQKPKSMRPRRSPGPTFTDSRMFRFLGPTNRRSLVAPLMLPTAAPRTGNLSLGASSFSGSRATSMVLCSVTIAAEFGSSGMKTAAKYWSSVPAQWNGPLMVAPPLTFLGSVRVTFSPGS